MGKVKREFLQLANYVNSRVDETTSEIFPQYVLGHHQFFIISCLHYLSLPHVTRLRSFLAFTYYEILRFFACVPDQNIKL